MVIQTAGEDSLQISYLSQFAESFTDVHYYYQQNMTLFTAIRTDMNKASEVYSKIQEAQQVLIEDHNLITMKTLEDLFRTL